MMVWGEVGGRAATWLCERIQYQPTAHLRVLARTDRENNIIGAVGYDGFTGTSCMMHCAGSHKRWLNKEFIFKAFDYPFNYCNMKVVFAQVPSGNVEALRMDAGLGFKLVTELKDAHPDGSLFILRMDKGDCRWVRNQQLRLVEVQPQQRVLQSH